MIMHMPYLSMQISPNRIGKCVDFKEALTEQTEYSHRIYRDCILFAL